ncbi:adenosylmethionine-8-amino-7-oxononanoate transaminase [Martiniozyma asiatica (nom. inval.)]|nr:adenosylmethionine-8-amino-7-oxononanoate transaminase [Martiniozyma asiatica]
MNDTDLLLQYDKKHVWHPYTSTINPLPCFLVNSAKGVQINLATGESLIDGMSSWWAAVHGYNNEELNEAATTQLQDMSHIMFGGLTHKPAINLAKKLIDMTAPDLQHCFLADSGSVAVEVSLKMAFQYCESKFGSDENFQKKKFLTVNYGYHGDTFGAMSVCDPVNSMHSLYSGYVRENIFVEAPQCKFDEEWNEKYIKTFKEKIEKHHHEVIAVIIEPIVQGAGGMRIYHAEYLRQVRQLCTKHNILLILDEIATGFGRTGKLFAYEHAGITPDILCLGKALTGGYLTLSAVLCTEDVAQTVCSGRAKGFMHGPTFMGNPLACSIALKSLEIIDRGHWKMQVANIEKLFKQTLPKLLEVEIVKDIRVLGAIGVVELTIPVDLKWFQNQFVKRGVWVRPFGKLVYLMPPFIIDLFQLTTLLTSVVEIIQEFAILQK